MQIFNIIYYFWMFVNNLFTYSRAHISKCKRCFNVKPSTYCFHMTTKILADFQVCANVPLKHLFYRTAPGAYFCLLHGRTTEKRSIPSKHLTMWRHVEDLFSVTIFRLPRRLGRQNTVTLHYDKSRQLFYDLFRF